MHPQLEILLQLQDLNSQRRELASHDRELEEHEFNINIEDALAHLDDRIEELKQELPASIRHRLGRFDQQAGARAVVPIINGICYGCFSALPTAMMSDLQRNDRVNHCEHCGRFVYVVTGN
jgi:predicted  nucleic acid-binding Zn-ribbon protein